MATAGLVGVFVGGAVFGYVTDKVGRQVMYLIDLIVLTLASLASAFVADAWQLIALRFVLGVAIGADYPIASSLLAEFIPAKHRGRLLGALFVVWAAGAAAAAGVGWALSRCLAVHACLACDVRRRHDVAPGDTGIAPVAAEQGEGRGGRRGLR